MNIEEAQKAITDCIHAMFNDESAFRIAPAMPVEYIPITVYEVPAEEQP